mgnify:CR=1 FL=1
MSSHFVVLATLALAILFSPETLVLGLVLMVVWRFMAPPFFQGVTLPKRSDLILETPEDEAAVVPRFGLPDSGNMPTVVAPDLSNLPAGETAINPETGEEFTKG